ncbi:MULTISPECIES: potassium-transporting ATPase subunit KdpA [unclassified Undibacterium]|uniref:potassium-transporting ATPase subunit KdpA n=1 Tax=unclassified Undibacterium TaxID=2630295 RepID=UPI002AC98FB7|nr:MULTISPECIES: potassium-transporting ATPase subunit KdpA [unclassified Undibacterium]MEB0139911.1 potassium-transporting ATPase subunit KdpA [Undibacterium sp. CCC2.1]MEB0171820.1 potassium-transporting ATPase subunit KdpA [Undibacterium sp. CCC1.1]MEB0175636.1 potassium-transporting ATPase subunit KdpA [Undibacterium sp. CCC3.4]MEB0216218.1 potassium-transporting ATPase subunit KdpA [Undibacterium sp. 5I2]WPX44111.1 potassium-transporting ATPase subunit KdpA [Undibacterium sp. CCC3.4]
MNHSAFFQIALYMTVLTILAVPLGRYIKQVMQGERNLLTRLLQPLERLLYRLGGIRAEEEMSWKQYAIAVLAFNLLGVLAVYGLQRLQLQLPLNPQAFPAVSVDSSFNTAISFVTNTNWQGYTPEASMSYLTQMLGLSVQNFLSAATGLAVAIALIRGFARHSMAGIGNFWVDLTRGTLYLLVPLALVFALAFMSQGVIQNFSAYETAHTVEKLAYSTPQVDAAGTPMLDTAGAPLLQAHSSTTQTLPMGPVASQEAIKMIGTNGGGFFNANSAHPFENPTPLTNFLQMLAIFLIPAALCISFGLMVGDGRQGWAIFAVMSVLFVALAGTAMYAEQQGNPLFTQLGLDQSMSLMQAGGNMEGKESRFGIAASGLFATITTAASCGAVNAMHDSFTPLGGMVPLVLMQLGEVVFGGVGAGMYGMLIFAILAVFIAGLMIGRTPEYLGKKIEAFEIKMIAITILIGPLLVLVGSALSVSLAAGVAGIANPGAHGFSEILYAFVSAANNNGSAFAGLSSNTPYYNVMLAIAMWFGRFCIIIPILATAGSLARKKRLTATAGTLPTHGPLFVMLLLGTIVIVGALTYIPALALGPVVEHLIMLSH